MTAIAPTTELKRTISSGGSQTKWGASAWVKLMYSNNSQSPGLVKTDCSSTFEATGQIETLQSTIISVRNINTHTQQQIETQTTGGGTYTDSNNASLPIVDTTANTQFTFQIIPLRQE